MEELVDGFIEALAQVAQQAAVVFEVDPEHLRDGDDILPMGEFFQQLLLDALCEGNNPFLMARGAKVTAFAGIGEQKLRMAG